MKVRLGDYIRIKTGKLDANASNPNGKYPFFTCSIEPLRINTYAYDCECVLVAGNGDLNIKYYFGKFNAYQRTYIIESKDKNILTVPYLYCFLDNYLYVLRSQSIGGVIKYIKLANLTDIKMELPSVAEQNEIVKKVDRIKRIINLRKQQLEKLDLLIKSQFNEMFGNCKLNRPSSDWVKIGTVAEVVGGSTPKTEKIEYWDGDHCWITPSEIDEDSYVIIDTDRKLTDAGIKSCSLKRLPIGTVLLSSRAPIGKVAIAGVEMYCNQGFKNLICSDKLTSVYVYYLLKYNSDYLNSLGRGATFKEISKSIVENISIPVPQIELQNEFVHFVEKVNKIKTQIKQSLEKLETLKKSLMQKYFG